MSNAASNEKKVIGLDTEWTFVHDSLDSDSETPSKTKVAILTLCDGDFCLIVQLPYLDSAPRSLLNFLRLPDYTFVGIGIRENIAKLEKEYGFGCKNSFDLRDLAGNVMRQPQLAACGVDELALELNLLKLQKPTSAVFNDWCNNKLNKKQVKLATLNVYAYFETGNKLLGAGDSSS
ncbi:unnamed protein product [Prunus armeniaca]|uniref:3'-5' exonuclease domain-containing protein n=1 Tax=Prunus armeniaca TaxID=36596 RepID=A0A6J5WPY3_PRUAR|nr:unnamed protein product [Prunus armeniaca]